MITLKGNPSQILPDLDALSKFLFGDHRCCTSRWCRFIGNPNCQCKSFPQGNPLANQILQSSLENVFTTYTGHSNNLPSLVSTQGNESLNYMVASKAPKNILSSSPGNISYRTAACVAQKKSVAIVHCQCKFNKHVLEISIILICNWKKKSYTICFSNS